MKNRYFKNPCDEDEPIIYFYSDASQKLIDDLSDINCDWYIVKDLLISWGYTVCEKVSNEN